MGPKAGKENGKRGEVILSIPCCFCFTSAIYHSINDTGLLSKQILNRKMTRVSSTSALQHICCIGIEKFGFTFLNGGCMDERGVGGRWGE